MNVDWSAGKYEVTAAELAPAAGVLVAAAAPARGERVLDLACGTGNVALLAAQHGADVIAVDSASRLLDVARQSAAQRGLALDLRNGDLLDLPLPAASVDAVISCFGIIFAPDPPRALGEVARVLVPGGRAYISAWVPAGPIDAMLTAMGRILRRVAPSPPRPRFAWSDPEAVRIAAAPAGLELQASARHELEIRGVSPEAYVDDGREHPMALATRDAVQAAGVSDAVRSAMVDALREANEDPDALLLHSPYVIHTLTKPR
jgi:SAM-dependent methyltransferase